MSTCKQSRSWTITVNNYDETVLDSLRKGLSSEAVRYAIFGYEIAPSTGTPHLQGYVSFKNKLTLRQVKEVVGDEAHIEVAKASEQKNREYCSKDGKTEEFGRRAAPGTRNDLDSFKNAVKAGCLNIKQLREDHSEVVAKYPRFCHDYIRDNIPAPEFEVHELNEWQAELETELNKPPCDRKVRFIIGRKGCNGKSWFAKYYCSKHEDAYLLRPGKLADMAYILPYPLRVLFIDCPRTTLEFLVPVYRLIEEIKDGYVQSSKYESCVKLYGPVHVVVLLNQAPDQYALSPDRYIEIDLDARKTIK